jgi:cytochrome b6-f complex iron-sulfur subunit
MSISKEVASGAPIETRRRFLKLSIGVAFLVTAAGGLVPILGFLWPRAGTGSSGGRVLVGPLSGLGLGKGTVVSLAGKPAIVINTNQGLRAFSAVCTHLSCIVKWEESKGYIQCPCHDGRFNPVTGAVISGPPPAPLKPLTVTTEAGQVYVGGAS